MARCSRWTDGLVDLWLLAANSRGFPMTMARVVVAELLDHLAEDDPAAMRSRRDLQRVHRVMGTRSIVRRALTHMTADRVGTGPLRVLELGAGDGSLMLDVARSVTPSWQLVEKTKKVEITLLDRQSLIGSGTIARYAKLGWSARAQVTDVLDWAADSADSQPRWDVIVANLFMHHFDSAQLSVLLGAIASKTDRFVACEPSRDWLALTGSRLIGAIGANAVTREDAVLSVRAGFCADELSALWPAGGINWHLQEYSAGLFSHCFCAKRLLVS